MTLPLNNLEALTGYTDRALGAETVRFLRKEMLPCYEVFAQAAANFFRRLFHAALRGALASSQRQPGILCMSQPGVLKA